MTIKMAVNRRAEKAEAELASVRQERDYLQESVWALEKKVAALAPHETCACSWDKVDDVCMHHSPKLAAVSAERDFLARQVAVLEEALDRIG